MKEKLKAVVTWVVEKIKSMPVLYWKFLIAFAIGFILGAIIA